MGKRIFLFLFFALSLCSSKSCLAQAGWRWGVSSHPDFNPGLEVTVATADDSGNVISGGCTGSLWVLGMSDYIVYGSDTVFNTEHHTQQIFVKCDSTGHFRWAKGSQHADVYPLGVVSDHAGNVYVYGRYRGPVCSFDTFNLTSTPAGTFFLLKYGPTGNVLFAKNVLSDSLYSSAGSLGIDGAGNLYLSGTFSAPSSTIGTTVLTNASAAWTPDVFVAKYDATGNPLWAKRLGGTAVENPGVMTVSKAGKVYFTGYFTSDSMVLGSTVLRDSVYSGFFHPQLPFLIKLDSSGSVVWAQQHTKHLQIKGMTLDTTEHLYLTGTIDTTVAIGLDTLHSAGPVNGFLAKFDSSGGSIWARSMGGNHGDGGWSVITDTCNNVWVAGTSMGSMFWIPGYTMNFGSYVLTMPPGAWDPVFLARYTDGGGFDTAFAVISGGDDVMMLLSDHRGALYLAGDYVHTGMRFGPDSLISPNTYEELYVAKYVPSGCPHVILGDVLQVGAATTQQAGFGIYPNPATDELTIVAADGITSVEITNLIGQTIFAKSYSADRILINVADIPAGIYIARINNTVVRKFVKQ